MASKWQFLKDKLPKAPFSSMSDAQDKSFVEKVAEVKRELATLSQSDLIRELADYDKEYEELKEAQKDLNVRWEAASQLLISLFESQQLMSVSTDDGRTVKITPEPYVGVKDHVALESYIEQNPELDYLYKIHPSSLTALVKGFLEEGKDDQIPPGLNVLLKSSIRLTKLKEHV